MDRMVKYSFPKNPNVSIIIPVYNRKNKLFRALNSVLNQTYKNFEIIVVDDGSTDCLEKSILKYTNNYESVIYLKQKNSGTPIALNKGIKISRGNYITFLDSDDIYLPDHIRKRVNIFIKNNKIDIIHTSAKIIGRKRDMFIPDARDPKRLIHLDNCIIGATIFGKREVFIKLNGFKNVYAHDFEFINRASKKFYVKKYDIPTYIYYRNSKDSILTNLKKKNEL